MMENDAKKVLSRVGLAYFVGTVVYVASYIIVLLIVKNAFPGALRSQTLNTCISMSTLMIIGYPIIYCMMKDLPVCEIPKKNMGVGLTISCFPIAYLIMVVFNMFGTMLNRRLGQLTGEGMKNPVANVMTTMSLPVMVLFVVILAPILEELVFRKLLVDRVKQYGEVLAMLLSGFMFGLFHGNLAQFAYAFGLGMFFAFIYMKTGRIIYTMMLHMFINGMSTFITSVLFRGIDLNKMMGYINSGDINGYMEFVQRNILAFAKVALFGLVVIVVVIIGLILAIVFRKKFTFADQETDLKGKEAWKMVFCNVGMILYIIWWIANIVINQFGMRIGDLVL